MAEALLITRNDIVKFTALNGNIDTDKFIQFIKIAQDIHIQQYLGTRLFRKIQDDIENSTLSGDYEDLVRDYIKPMLIHWSMVEYLPWASYSLSNKGVFKHNSENSDTVDKVDVDFLVEKSRSLAEHYTQRFIDYICNNSSTFPEYNENNNGDVDPNTDNFYAGWYI
jgi:hypothetical protein